MVASQNLPDPDELSADYLIAPRPRSHEFRFPLRVLLLLTTSVCLLAALARLVYVALAW